MFWKGYPVQRKLKQTKETNIMQYFIDQQLVGYHINQPN